MAFYEQVFPECISVGMEGGPRFIAMEANTIGGQRYTNLLDPYPLHQFSLAQPPQYEEEFELLRAFFWAVRGIDGFRFKDWSDFMATRDNTSLTLISGTTWQMNRIYVSPGRTAIRPIYKPVTGAQIWRLRSGSSTDITGSSTINTTNGQVVITGHAGGDAYTWVGEFHLPAAFGEPQMLARALGGAPNSRLVEWPDIDIRETREIA